MTWIQVVRKEDATGRLQQVYKEVNGLYPEEYHTPVDSLVRPDGTSDSIVAAHSLLPEVLRHTFGAHAGLLHPDLSLSRRQQEMIATVVSALNSCHY